MLAGLFRQGAAEVGLPRAGEALEHDVLLPVDERAGPELGDQSAIQASFLDEIESSEVGCRVAQPGPPDQPFDLRMRERGVGLVDHEADPFIESKSEGEGLVLGLEGVEERGGAHLAEFAFGLDIDAAHRWPPA